MGYKTGVMKLWQKNRESGGGRQIQEMTDKESVDIVAAGKIGNKIYCFLEPKIKHQSRKKENDTIEVLYLDNTTRYFFNNKLHNEKDCAVIYSIRSRKPCEYWLEGRKYYPENFSSFKNIVKEYKEQKIIKNKLESF